MADSTDPRLGRMARATIDRYTARYKELGVSPKTLGWGSETHQQIRFGAVRSLVDLNGRTILDWGCGFGDLAGHLAAHDVAFEAYIGVDLNADLIREAELRYGSVEKVSFAVASPEDPFPAPHQADVVVMLGLANFEQPDLDTEDYAQLLLRRGFDAAHQAVVCDFLSAVPTPGYEREDFVHYYDPALVLQWGLALSSNVVLMHDYPPIPQREMLIRVDHT